MFQREDRVSGFALLREWMGEDLEAEKATSRGKLTPSTRRKINRALEKAGFDGNARMRSMGQAMGEIAGALRHEGVEVDEPITADRFRHSHGQAAFHVAFSNAHEPMRPKRITNSMLAVQWTELHSGYEVVAYMS